VAETFFNYCFSSLDSRNSDMAEAYPFLAKRRADPFGRHNALPCNPNASENIDMFLSKLIY
jgi:hypothetical protein